ncbi:MAG: hypothetical protein ABIP30_17560 [Ferruginibacter sp.]
MKNDLLENINQQFALSIPENTDAKNLEHLLAERINYLIINDFNWLVQALYRIDVNEKKLELLLKENNKYNAGNIIAALVIERQLQKIKSRQQNRRDENNINDAERW